MAGDENINEDDSAGLQLAENLREIVGTFVRRIRSQADTPTTSQSEALSLLDREGPLSVAELAERRNVKHQSMRLVAAQLEAERLISKAPHPADGRSQLLSITQAGRAELGRARSARTEEIAKAIKERLSDEERRMLGEAIRIIEKLL